MLDERLMNEPDPRKLTIREMRLRCQNTAPAPERETFTGKRARFFSIYLTKLFLRTPITPNQMTALSVLVFFVGVSLFLLQVKTWAIVGACLVFFATVLDGCDGEIARFRKTKSPVGGLYAEPVSHDVQYGLMFLPLGLAASLATGSVWWLVCGFVASTTKLLTRLVETRFWMMSTGVKIRTEEETKKEREVMKERPSHLKFVSWIKRNTLSSNGMILPLLLAAIFDKVTWYVAVYGAAYALLWVVTFFRQLPKLKAISQAATNAVPGSAD